MGFTNEFKVGVFVMVALAMVIGGYFLTYDGVVRGTGAYEVHLSAPSANGMFPGTPVRLAGVVIGSIDDIEVSGNNAHITMLIEADHPLPVGTEADIKASGLLGDTYIGLVPTTQEEMLSDGAWIELRETPGDLDAVTKQVEAISDDVKAITAELRRFAENQSNRDHIEATIANIDAISEQLRVLTERSRGDVEAIVDSVRRLTENLEGIVDATGDDVDEEMEKIKDATDTLQGALDDVKSITGKIDDGEGTVGALLNERDTIDALNETIGNANSVIEGFSGLRTKVYYVGRYYLGSQPTRDADAFFSGNPLHNTGSNTIGVQLHSQEDFWYSFEFVDYPIGTVDYVERYVPDIDQVYTEWVREPNYRFTFQFNKRWWDLAFRLGVKDSGGGIGMTWFTLNDRLRFDVDVFDFEFGAYPAVSSAGIPNIRLGTRWEPLNGIFFEAGGEQLFLGARHGYVTGYLGAGFHFNDDDIKLLFATLPLGSL